MHERNTFQNAVAVLRKGKANPINMMDKTQKFYHKTELKLQSMLSVAQELADSVTEIVQLIQNLDFVIADIRRASQKGTPLKENQV